MLILYASDRPPYPFFLGGAARCAHQLLRTMSGELHIACMAAGSSDYDVAPWSYPEPAEFDALGVRAVHATERGGTVDCGYPITLFPDFHDGLGELIDAFRPDVVWAQLEGARAILEFANSKGVQGILFVHDAEFDPADLRAIGDLGSHVVCSSRFLARKARKVIRREARVVYPCPETNFGVAGDRNGHITMINPHRVKGIATFIEIAKRLPKERFLLVESWKLNDQDAAALNRQLAEVTNIRYVRRVSDMRQIYGQTRLIAYSVDVGRRLRHGGGRGAIVRDTRHRERSRRPSGVGGRWRGSDRGISQRRRDGWRPSVKSSGTNGTTTPMWRVRAGMHSPRSSRWRVRPVVSSRRAR